MKADAVIVDRFDFAATNMQALRKLRDEWIGFASQASAFYFACKRAGEAELESQKRSAPAASASSAKRACGVGVGDKFACLKDWTEAAATRAASAAHGLTFLPVKQGEVVMRVPEVEPDPAWMLVRRLDGEEGYVPFLRLGAVPDKPVMPPPELSDGEDELEPPTLEEIQVAVNSSFDDADSFELGDFMNDFESHGKDVVGKLLANLVANGPPPGCDGIKIKFDEATGTYSRVAEEPKAAEKPNDELLVAKITEVFAASKPARDAGQDYSIRELYKALDDHFNIDIRELKLKPFITETIRKLEAEEDTAADAAA